MWTICVCVKEKWPKEDNVFDLRIKRVFSLSLFEFKQKKKSSSYKVLYLPVIPVKSQKSSGGYGQSSGGSSGYGMWISQLKVKIGRIRRSHKHLANHRDVEQLYAKRLLSTSTGGSSSGGGSSYGGGQSSGGSSYGGSSGRTFLETILEWVSKEDLSWTILAMSESLTFKSKFRLCQWFSLLV